uniref:HTH-type transcriptional regulator HdfR n=1 Tax=Thaumasiovibrio occultus TaxID=1891184 RepID=UPI000B3612B6|nr:HTH-type transcriptional regulator HdfR [Thaumasiovibrio occultus]
MDTELLRTFLEVSKTRHFGKAADNLFLTQSAVSFRIRQLEGQLGNPLFSRQRGNIHLTQAGERLQPYAEAILQTWGRAKQDVALTTEQNVQLAFGASPMFWEFEGVSPWLDQCYNAIEGLAFRLDSAPRQEMARKIYERQIDVGLTSEPPKGEELVVKKLCDYEMHLITAKPNLKMEQCENELLVILDWGTRFAIEHAKHTHFNRPAVMQTQSPRTALNFITSNGGIAYLPTPVAATALAEGQCFVVEDAPVMEHSLYMVWHQDNEKSEIIAQVAEIALNLASLQ